MRCVLPVQLGSQTCRLLGSPPLWLVEPTPSHCLHPVFVDKLALPLPSSVCGLLSLGPGFLEESWQAPDFPPSFSFPKCPPIPTCSLCGPTSEGWLLPP